MICKYTELKSEEFYIYSFTFYFRTMDHPKKIVFTCNTSWGIYKFRINLIRQLIKRGYTIYVLAPEDRYTGFLTDEQGLIFIPLKHLRAVSFSLFNDLKLYNELRRHYTSIKPWLIFHYTIKANIYGALAAARAGCPSISVITGLGYTFLNDTWVLKVVSAMYRFALKKASEVWFLNNDDRDYFISNKIINKHKTFILPGEGVDTHAFHCDDPYQIRSTLTFLLIGRIIKEKGIAEYVNAARILKQKGYAVECQLVGIYDYKNPSSIPHKIFFNWVGSGLITYLGSTDDVKPLIEKADCIVLPSYREGLPLSLLEGASMCRPLIAADTAGCREVVVHGINGFLCPEKDGEGLAIAMEEFYHLSPAERMRMGREARKLAVAQFALEKIHAIYFNKISSYAGDRPALKESINKMNR
jgi:glycosyltransferase involved in cell wall biosynthesis